MPKLGVCTCPTSTVRLCGHANRLQAQHPRTHECKRLARHSPCIGNAKHAHACSPTTLYEPETVALAAQAGRVCLRGSHMMYKSMTVSFTGAPDSAQSAPAFPCRRMGISTPPRPAGCKSPGRGAGHAHRSMCAALRAPYVQVVVQQACVG